MPTPKSLIAAEPVSAYDAKTHLPKLLERTEKGDRFVITRHGKPVARLVPIDDADQPAQRELIAAVARMRRNLADKGITLGSILEPGEQLSDLTHGAHRYAERRS